MQNGCQPEELAGEAEEGAGSRAIHGQEHLDEAVCNL